MEAERHRDREKVLVSSCVFEPEGTSCNSGMHFKEGKYPLKACDVFTIAGAKDAGAKTYMFQAN